MYYNLWGLLFLSCNNGDLQSKPAASDVDYSHKHFQLEGTVTTGSNKVQGAGSNSIFCFEDSEF